MSGVCCLLQEEKGIEMDNEKKSEIFGMRPKAIVFVNANEDVASEIS